MKKFLIILVCFVVALFLSTDKRVFSKNSSNDVFRVDILGINDKPGMNVLSEEANITIPGWCKDCVTSSGSFSNLKQNATWSVQAKRNDRITIRLMGPDVRLDGKRVPVYVVYKNLVVNGGLVSDGSVVVSHDKPYKYTIDMKAGQKVEFSVIPEKAGASSYWQTLHIKWYMLVLYFGGLMALYAIVRKLLKKKSK